MAIAKEDDVIDGTWHPVLEEPYLNLDRIDLQNVSEEKFKKLEMEIWVHPKENIDNWKQINWINK